MKPLELYIHIPFCVRKCAYCDFTSAGWGKSVQTAYFQALRQEICQIADMRKTKAGSEQEFVCSCFFGGGTPSVPDPWELVRTLDLLREKFLFADDCEITMEANPGTLNEAKLIAYKEAGFNRISLGCQAVQDRLLERIGRIHTYRQVEDTIHLIRQTGFTNLNVDLMSGLPGQTFADYEESLRTIAELGCEHISAYSLILEEGTPLYEEEGELDLPDEDTERRMYTETGTILAEYGFEQYEISNYARPGYACRHNIGYWERTDYLGFGLSAASLDGMLRRTNTSDMQMYLKTFGDSFTAMSERVPSVLPSEKEKEAAMKAAIWTDVQELTVEDCMEETMFLGLRMMRGVGKMEFAQRFGKTMEEVYGPVLDKYQKLGLLQEAAGRIFLSKEGISISNPILADFLF